MNSFPEDLPDRNGTTENYTNVAKLYNTSQNAQPLPVLDLPQLITTLSALPNDVYPSNIDGEDTEDDDMEWEEVDIMQNTAPNALQTQNVEIILERAPETIRLVKISNIFAHLTPTTGNVVTQLISWSVNYA